VALVAMFDAPAPRTGREGCTEQEREIEGKPAVKNIIKTTKGRHPTAPRKTCTNEAKKNGMRLLRPLQTQRIDCCKEIGRKKIKHGEINANGRKKPNYVEVRRRNLSGEGVSLREKRPLTFTPQEAQQKTEGGERDPRRDKRGGL